MTFTAVYLWSWPWRGFLRCVGHYIWRVYYNLQAARVGTRQCRCRLCCPRSGSPPWTDLQWPNQDRLTNTAAGLETHAEAAWAGGVCTVHTLRRIFSVDGEHGGLIGGPVDQTRAVRRHVRTVSVVHIELQRTLWEETNEHSVQWEETDTDWYTRRGGVYVMKCIIYEQNKNKCANIHNCS